MRRPERWPTDSPSPEADQPTVFDSRVLSHLPSCAAVMLTTSSKSVVIFCCLSLAGDLESIGFSRRAWFMG